jgi:hypothetical protein
VYQIPFLSNKYVTGDKKVGAEIPVNYPLDSSGFSNSLRIPTNLWKTSQCQIKKIVDCSGVVSLAEMDGQTERFLTF